MSLTVGIPNAMLYHEFGSLWKSFFENMKIPVCVSSQTNKQVLDRGTILSVDESCLPLKVYLGHVDSLLPRCSHIFVPRIAQYHPGFHFCAKFAGLPDIVRNTFRLSRDQIVAPDIEGNSALDQLRALYTACRQLERPIIPSYASYRKALAGWKTAKPASTSFQPRIAVIGHSYLLCDSYFYHDIERVLTARHMAIVTPDQVPGKTLYEEAKHFDPDIYWQLSAKIAGAAHFFCRQPDVAGILLVSSFGCGPDSLVNEYVAHHIFEKSDLPHIVITIDEHSGNAGLVTRVEAFLDVVERRLSR